MKTRLHETLVPGVMFILEEGIRAIDQDPSTVVRSYYDLHQQKWVELKDRVCPSMTMVYDEAFTEEACKKSLEDRLSSLVESAPHDTVMVVDRDTPIAVKCQENGIVVWKGDYSVYLVSW